jgi:hypothetical protein
MNDAFTEADEKLRQVVDFLCSLAGHTDDEAYFAEVVTTATDMATLRYKIRKFARTLTR